jgi:hypothetical protein
MRVVSSIAELNLELQQVLEHHGCALVSSRHLADDARAYRDESQIYDLNSETTTNEPFFHYLVDAGTAIFLFDGDPFLFYVLAFHPHELITYLESESTKLDVEQAKDYVATMLGKRADIAASAEIAGQWMDG